MPMRFALYNHDTLVGFTDLDIPCVQSCLRQGFLEPVGGADAILDAATGVPAALAAMLHARREAGGEAPPDDAAVKNALNARDTLELALCDEQGKPFECDFIRIYDLKDDSFEDVYDMYSLDEDLARASAPDAAPWEADDDPFDDPFDPDDYDQPWRPVDDRWNTEPFLIQVFLHDPNRFRDDAEAFGSESPTLLDRSSPDP